MLKYTLLVSICMSVLFAGCNRKSYRTEVTQLSSLSPRGEVLASYLWKETSVQAYKILGNDTLQYNITHQFEKVDKDDLTLFREDGSFLFEEGQTKFTPQSSQKYTTGTWQLTDNASRLILKTSHITDQYEIIELDTTKAVLKLPVTKQQHTYYYLITYSPIAKTAFGEEKTRLRANTIYKEVDQQPQYPGGNQALARLISKYQVYPKEARKKGVQGKVMVQFVVSAQGVPQQFTILQSVGYSCDQAVLQTCQAMKTWQPGLLNGKPVPVYVTLPVIFKL